MPDPTLPDDELLRTARAYMARLTSVAPPPNLVEDSMKAALSRRRRFSVAGLLGGGAVILAGATAAVVALAFHNPPIARVPAGASTPAVSTVLPTMTPAIASIPAITVPTPVADVCQANPSPATSRELVVSQPVAYAQVRSPMSVGGRINAFEATFQIAVKDASGRNLASMTGHSQQGQTLSSFSEGLPFNVHAETSACVWVFQLSAKDGSPQMIQQVPVTLIP